MKVLMLNGSPRAKGNTALALAEMEAVFAREGIEVQTVQVGNQAIRGCIACNTCAKTGKCVFDDVVNELADKFKDADGLPKNPINSPILFDKEKAVFKAKMERPCMQDRSILPFSTGNTPNGKQ